MATKAGPFNAITFPAVEDALTEARNRAEDAYSTAVDVVDTLSNYFDEYNPEVITTMFETAETSAKNTYVPPAVPVEPKISLSVPTFPTFGPKSIAVANQEVPGITLSNVQFSNVSAPAKFNKAAPTNTELALPEDYGVPSDPSIIVPNVPSLQSLNIPSTAELDSITLPTASGIVLPSTTDYPVPALTFSWSEAGYTSESLEALTAALMTRLYGGTGLEPTIEQAIWDRARNREDRNALRSKSQQLIEFAASGFKRPQGSQYAVLDFFIQETQNKIADFSREVAIKQAELEQENLRLTIQNMLALEQLLGNLYNEQQRRGFEAAKYLQQAAIDIFNAAIRRIESDVNITKLAIEIFNANLRSELAKLDLFKGKLEAEQLVGTINEQTIKNFSLELQGLITRVSLFKEQVEAVKTKIQADALRLENIKNKIGVFTAEIQAKNAEISGYSEMVKAEQVKVTAQESIAKIQETKSNVMATQANINIKQAEANIESERTRVLGYQAQIEGLHKAVQAIAAMNSAALSLYEGKAKIYASQIGANTAVAELDLKVVEDNIQRNKAIAEVELKKADLNIQNALNATKLKLDAMQSSASVAAQLAAGSMAAIHVSASESAQLQFSNSYNESNDVT